MRKRKSPIVLVTLLIVIVAGVAGSQYVAGRTTPPGGDQAQPQPTAPPVADDHKMLGEKRAPESTSNIAGQLSAQMGSKGSSPETPHGPPGEGSSGPMVLNPASTSSASQKPTPNPTSTSTQWYNDESANGSKKD